MFEPEHHVRTAIKGLVINRDNGADITCGRPDAAEVGESFSTN